MPEIELDSCGQGEWSLPPHGFKTGGVYKVVNQLVLPNGEGRCFTIPRDDVLIDCQDNSINGVSRESGGIGFYVYNDNVEIKNCNFLSLDKAIVLDNAHNNKITRNVFWHNSWGLFIENSNDNIFFDNKLTDNFYGASFIASSRNQFTGNTACNNQFEDTNEIISLLVQGSVQFNSNNFGHGNYLDKKNIKGLNNNINSQECIALQPPPPVPEAEPVEALVNGGTCEEEGERLRISDAWHVCEDVSGSNEWRILLLQPCQRDNECVSNSFCEEGECVGQEGTLCGNNNAICANGLFCNVETELCAEPVESDCDDNNDNDEDGDVDCSDVDCSNDDACDGDNDNDGYVDEVDACDNTPLDKSVQDRGPMIGCQMGDYNGDGEVTSEDVEKINDDPDKFWNNYVEKDPDYLHDFIKALVDEVNQIVF